MACLGCGDTVAVQRRSDGVWVCARCGAHPGPPYPTATIDTTCPGSPRCAEERARHARELAKAHRGADRFEHERELAFADVAEARGIIAALVEAWPKCDECGAPAAHRGQQFERVWVRCDAHPLGYEMPHAQALRAALAFLAEVGK
jgi:ribosomal protein L37AE/L43A